MRDGERGGVCAAVGSTQKESQLHALNISLIGVFGVNYGFAHFFGRPAAPNRGRPHVPARTQERAASTSFRICLRTRAGRRSM
jgi:hypothetical protein